MENRLHKFSFRYIRFILLVLLINHPVCYGQNKGYLITADKVLVDALDAAYRQVQAGDTLYFASGNRNYLYIKNFQGKPGLPIVMVNTGGEVIIDTDNYYGISIQNCRYIKFTGTGYAGQFYGFKIKRVTNGAGVGIGYQSSDVEIDHVSIENTMIGGLYAKTDPDCNLAAVRGEFTQYNTIIHDNYIANTGNEGLYIGSTKYDGQIVNCNGKDTLLMPSLLDGVKVYSNTIKNAGYDGIQVSSASRNCQIYDNTIIFDSQKAVDTQMSGIIIGGGTKCDCFNNYIAHGNGDGIECHGLGGTRIFNNIIVDAGLSYLPNDKTRMKHGIFVSDVSVQKDSSFYILNNNIIHPKSEGIRFSSIVSKGNHISNNVIINPGNFDYYQNGNTKFKGKDAYIMFQNTVSQATMTNNYLARDGNSAGFISKNMDLPGDFILVYGSPLIDVANILPKAAVTFDFLHHPRPYGPKLDAGAYEYDRIFSFSDIIANKPANTSWLIRNPVTDLLQVCLKTESEADFTTAIYDLHGALVSSLGRSRSEFGIRIYEVNVFPLKDGVYIYLIRSGKSLFTGKFIKLTK